MLNSVSLLYQTTEGTVLSIQDTAVLRDTTQHRCPFFLFNRSALQCLTPLCQTFLLILGWESDYGMRTYENQWKLEGTFRDPLTKAHTFMCLGIVFHRLLFKARQLQNVLQKEFLHIKQSSFDCKKKVEEKTFTANMCFSTSTDSTYGHINIPSILLYGLLYLIVFVNVSAVAQIKQQIMDNLCADNGKKYVEIIIRYNQLLLCLCTICLWRRAWLRIKPECKNVAHYRTSDNFRETNKTNNLISNTSWSSYLVWWLE